MAVRIDWRMLFVHQGVKKGLSVKLRGVPDVEKVYCVVLGLRFRLCCFSHKDLPDLCHASFKSEEIPAKHESSPVSSRRK